ncbi:MAG: cobyric acid synthase [Methanomicrobiales archaeon]|nr:cobyric acid synthase [Methanomicrobiales archaeon]MDI6875281.1 cobyric acid synthase [Methanomicrobiales archaeon]
MSLMVLGTASHVGKSVTVAAILRALERRGIRAAPFKSQNMSLNSYVTPDGGEIGIAQAMQAWAARLAPERDMNPILLKPKGDQTSQIVLLGSPYKDVHISEYYRETDALLQESLRAYRRLEGRYGHVVVEGAGGAAELNLYDRDIANVRLAKALKIPIVLVADIERGGVFAQVFGTVELLPRDVRDCIVGLIINKFRGDPAIFADGLKQLEEISGLPVLGVVPCFDIPLPSEDSLSLADKRPSRSSVRIAVVRLPHISNFTDFEILERSAAVEYVPLGRSLRGYDCIIIPGTKNTIEDLQKVKESGTAEEILLARRRNIPIIGICGGYQMLGRTIVDSGVESRRGEYAGLGLLDSTTYFEGYRKTTVQVRRRARAIPPLLLHMGTVCGYEIHMGRTERGSASEAFEGDGAASEDGLVFGTYMHGLFQNPSAVRGLLRYLQDAHGDGSGELSGDDPPADAPLTDSYDRLADWYEAHVDMDFVASFFRDGLASG